MTTILTAVDLDEALSRLTAAQLAAIKRVTNTAWADQLHTAQKESVALMEAAENMPGGSRRLPHTDIDAWLRLGLLDTLCKWLDGTARTCMHSPDPRRPEPVWSAAWKPGLVVCAHCVGLLKAVGDADRTCDVCGRVCAGVEHGDGIFTVTVWAAALAYSGGTCTACRPNCAQAAQ